MSGIEDKYSKAVKQRLQEIKLEGGAKCNHIYQLEERISRLHEQIRETDEAIAAGNDAVNQILSIEKSLSSAEGWGTFDMLGGGMFSDMAKHSHLDDIQAQVERLIISSTALSPTGWCWTG